MNRIKSETFFEDRRVETGMVVGWEKEEGGLRGCIQEEAEQVDFVVRDEEELETEQKRRKSDSLVVVISMGRKKEGWAGYPDLMRWFRVEGPGESSEEEAVTKLERELRNFVFSSTQQ
jgi:hypothetical protein